MSTSNPFAPEIDVVLALVYTKPSPGFKARLIILGVLGILAFVSTIVHIVCQHLLAVRRGGKQGSFWLARRVSRSSGSFIVLNPILFKEGCGIAIGVLTPVIVTLAWKGFYDHKSLAPVFNASEITYWPIAFILGWCTTVANLQTYLLLRDDKSSEGRCRFLTARLTNIFFFGWLAIGTAGCMVMVGFELKGNHTLGQNWVRLFEFVSQEAAAWQPGDNTTIAMETLQELKRAFSHSFDRHLSIVSKSWGAYIVVHIFIILVTCATYPLVRSLKAQIQSSLRELQQQQTFVLDKSTESPEDDVNVHPGKIPSLSQVRAMAERQSMSLEAAKRLRTMARITSDLQIQVVGFLVIAVALLAGCIFFAIAYPRLSDDSWAAKELIIFFPLWALLLPQALSFLALAVNSVKELRAQSLTRLPSILPSEAGTSQLGHGVSIVVESHTLEETASAEEIRPKPQRAGASPSLG